MLCFFATSGYILYNNFYSPQGYVPGRGFGQAEADINISAVKILDVAIDDASRNLDADGVWKKIEQNPQFLDLNGDSMIPIEIGSYGNRDNPFLQITYEVKKR